MMAGVSTAGAEMVWMGGFANDGVRARVSGGGAAAALNSAQGAPPRTHCLPSPRELYMHAASVAPEHDINHSLCVLSALVRVE